MVLEGLERDDKEYEINPRDYWTYPMGSVQGGRRRKRVKEITHNETSAMLAEATFERSNPCYFKMHPDVLYIELLNIKWHRLAIFMSHVVNSMDKRRKIKIFSIFNEIEIFMLLILN